MKISNVVNRGVEPAEEAVVLGPAHKALLEVVQGLVAQAGGVADGNPIIKIFQGLLPAMAKDIARIPEAELRRVCGMFAEQLSNIANGGGEHP